MKPFEEGKLIGEALAEMRDGSKLTMTEEEMQESAALVAAYLLPDDEEAQRIFAAGLLWGTTQE